MGEGGEEGGGGRVIVRSGVSAREFCTIVPRDVYPIDWFVQYNIHRSLLQVLDT